MTKHYNWDHFLRTLSHDLLAKGPHEHAVEILDGGVSQGWARRIDFGANLTVTVTGDEADVSASGGGGGSITVQEEDGAPLDAAVTIIRVPNSGLTDNGAGDVSLGYELAGAVAAHTGDATDAHDASAISILDAAGDFTATDVEGALAELQADAEAHVAAGDPHSGYATDTDLTNHLNDAADAHDASAISILDTANDFTATDVEGALAELQSDNEAHVAAADPHTGYVREADANWTDLTDGGSTALHSHAGVGDPDLAFLWFWRGT